MAGDAFFSVGNRPRSVTGIRRDSGGTPQSLQASVPDGDTTGVHVEGRMLVRFLGIDTPEKRIDLPGANTDADKLLSSAAWEDYLSDPFRHELGVFDLDADLRAHLANRIGPGAAANHHRHAVAAGESLVGLVQADMDALGKDTTTFRYFVAFEFEVFDSNGRFLAFVNRDQPNPTVPGPRPLSYNERQLEKGVALPFFIWPNIDPFRTLNLVEAVLKPGTAPEVANSSPALRRSRTFVQQARANKRGVFDDADPLRFEAFEIRYLARRAAPDRAVIDLSRDDDVILPAQHYFHVPNPEDRLFIPPHFVPLFLDRGWRLQA
jgi:hypothetical protein